ncbi:MAG: nitroreductase [Pseudomonadales bacterium]
MTMDFAEQLHNSMPVEVAIRNRRSVRGFKPDAVSEKLLERLFTLSQWAPSNCNTQPWRSFVVSGDTLQSLRQKIHNAVVTGEAMVPDYPYDPSGYVGVYKDRQYGSAKALYSAMEIERSDKQGRFDAFLRNYEFFDAPHAVFLFMSSNATERDAADVGMYAQTLMLSMMANGIGSCAQGALSFYPQIIRDELNIQDDLKCLFGMSFGYEDTSVAANKTQIDRAPLYETTTFYN